jgi:hypothetical protein
MNKNLAVEQAWIPAVMLVNDISAKYGGPFIDTSCHQIWDAGQLVCRIAYGPDWMLSEKFRECDEANSPPPEFMEAARNVLKELPPYIQVKP